MDAKSLTGLVHHRPQLFEGRIQMETLSEEMTEMIRRGLIDHQLKIPEIRFKPLRIEINELLDSLLKRSQQATKMYKTLSEVKAPEIAGNLLKLLMNHRYRRIYRRGIESLSEGRLI